MPQPTRTPRSTARVGTGRFARQGTAQSGRFARPGAAQTRTSRPQTRSTPRGRNRPTPTRFGRKPQQKKGIAGVLGGLLPTGAASKATPSSKKGKAGGFAAIAALAGVAFQNRDKLTGMLKNRGGGATQTEYTPTTPVSPATTPSPVRPGDTGTGL